MHISTPMEKNKYDFLDRNMFFIFIFLIVELYNSYLIIQSRTILKSFVIENFSSSFNLFLEYYPM